MLGRVTCAFALEGSHVSAHDHRDGPLRAALALVVTHVPRHLSPPLALRLHGTRLLPLLGLFAPALVVAEAVSIFRPRPPLTAPAAILASLVALFVAAAFHDAPQRRSRRRHARGDAFRCGIKELLWRWCPLHSASHTTVPRAILLLLG